MKKLLLLLLVCYASPAAAQMCSTDAGNAPYDIVQTWTDFWDQGANGFNWDVRINGTNWAQYGAQLIEGGGCLHQCLPIQFTAKTSNIRIENVVTSGNASGWKCSQFTQIVGHAEGAVKAAKKAIAAEKSERYNQFFFFFTGFSVGPCAFGLGVTCVGSGSAALISLALKDEQDKIVQNDPWDGDYLLPYDPPWPSAEELGLSYTDDYYVNQMIGDTQGVAQMADFIVVETNRASSCEMANVDCSEWHRDRVNWGLWMLGWYLNDLGNNAWTVAWEMEQEGADNDGVAAMRDFAQTSNDAGWEYQQ